MRDTLKKDVDFVILNVIKVLCSLVFLKCLLTNVLFSLWYTET